MNKFKIFCAANETMPYMFKKMVLQAAVATSLLYGCESWITNNLKDAEHLYIGAVKALLGVRETTRSDTVLIEAGMPSMKQLVRERTKRFMEKELSAERGSDTPLIRIYKICEAKRTGGFNHLRRILDPTEEHVTVVESLRPVTTSKVRTYKEINPELSIHPVYTTKDYINERERLVFTRFRLCSHHLKIETGRWARVNAEDRVCDCGLGVQDESHVLFDCVKTEDVRAVFGVTGGEFADIGELMMRMDVHKLVSFVCCCMKKFD